MLDNYVNRLVRAELAPRLSFCVDRYWRSFVRQGVCARTRQMTSQATIRRSKIEDAAEVRACLDSVARERRFLAMVEAPSVDEVAAYIAQPDVVQVVAVDGDAIVGWADVRRMRTPGLRHRGALGMGVVSGHRRRGIGSRLLTATIEAADTLDIQRLELQVFRSNAPAVRLYETHGFHVEGEQPKARILDDIADDILLMCRWCKGDERE
jgi:ribosomal protein S18 acetylase RimI-like enzyme